MRLREHKSQHIRRDLRCIPRQVEDEDGVEGEVLVWFRASKTKSVDGDDVGLFGGAEPRQTREPGRTGQS